jgi:hypothetical protein
MTTGQLLVAEIIMAHASAMERGVLSIWTIYDKPTDYPDGFIARRYEVGGSKIVVATNHTITSPNIDQMRETFERAGLTKLRRAGSDDANIVESWI